MKFSLAVAALAGAAAAHEHHNHARHHRNALVARAASTCGCTTVYSTIYGQATLVPPPPALPTPTVYTAPGTYTIGAKTVTVYSTTTVCAATATVLPSGTHTVGGVTTVVEHSTTVICPVAAVETSNGISTSVIKTTTYVCPAAGTYTIGASTVSPSVSTLYVYPVPTSYTPGTYTQQATTVTITKTLDVYICPYATSTVTVIPVQQPTSAPQAPAAPAPAAPAKNGLWAITYSPYNNDKSCKSAGDVDADILVIKNKGFTTVRIYATDCNGLVNVGVSARKYGLKVIVGIFITKDGTGPCESQITTILGWKQWDLVEFVVVGNEAIHNKYVTAGALAGFISSVKGRLSGAGYTGPVTTAETVDVIQANSGALCAVLDILGPNIHPYFDAGTAASAVGPFVQSQLALVAAACPGKTIYILETGWPSQGSPNGKAVAGVNEQQVAVAAIKAVAGGKAAFFSFRNDMWKDPGPLGIEQFFGLGQLF